MGTSHLIDTNALSDYLGKRLPETGMNFMDSVLDDAPSLSVINRIELLGHNLPELPLFKVAVAGCEVYDLTETIILRTIALRKSRRIKIPDAIIAATALVYDLTLITHNLSDFEGIPGLKLVDAYLV